MAFMDKLGQMAGKIGEVAGLGAPVPVILLIMARQRAKSSLKEAK